MLPGLKVKIGADTSELDRKLSNTQARLRRFARIAAAATAAVATATAALYSRTAAAIDEQAKLAQSLNTTVRSIQVLERAGELAGVSMGGIQQATSDLTRRLSQAAAGVGPAVDALDSLGLTAGELLDMPLDRRIQAINEAIEEFVPAAQRAAVAGMFFGEEGSLALSRLDTATLQQAIQDVDDFGVALSEVEADQIEAANDALSRVALVARGLANQLTAALAPAVERVANAFANVMREGHPFREMLEAIAGRMIAYGAVIAAGVTAWGAYAAAVRVATLATAAFNGALVLTRAALIRTGIGAVVVILGELAYRAYEASQRFGGMGTVIEALKTMFIDRFERMKASIGLFKTNFLIMVNEIKFAFTQAMVVMASSFYSFINGVTAGMNEALGTALSTTMGEGVIQGLTEDLGALNDTYGTLMDQQYDAEQRLAQPLITLRDLLQQGREEAEALGTTIDETTDGMVNGFNMAAGAAGNLETALTAAQERSKSAAEMIGSKMEEAMMSMVDGTKSAKDAFKAMARSIILELYRIFVVKRITGFITRAIGGAFGVPSSALPSYEGGGFTGTGSRSGGVDGRGGIPAIVHPNETIIDHTRPGSSPSLGGSMVVNQTLNIQTGVAQTVRTEMRNLMPQFVEAAKAAVLDSKRRGGSYGSAMA